LEMQDDGSAAFPALNVLDAEVCLASGFPVHSRGSRLAGLAREYFDPVGHDEGRGEAHAELADTLAVLALIAGKRLQELRSARFRDGAAVLDPFIARHADAIVADQDTVLLRVDLHAYFQLGVILVQAAVCQ